MTKVHVFIHGVEYKWCTTCSQHRALSEFSTNNDLWDGKQRKCKPCRKQHYKNNKAKVLKKSKEHYDKNKKRYARTRKKHYQNNKAAYKENSRLNKAKLRRESPEFRLKENARSRLRTALKLQGVRKCFKTQRLLRCSPLQLRHHLEKHFTVGMTWENYGTGWHMDHDVPCAAFNLSNAVELHACSWYKNIRPMWASDNIKKSDKYSEEDKQKLIEEWIFYNI